MPNPYSPPRQTASTQSTIARLQSTRILSTLNGMLLGLATGLLTCDLIDLSPDDLQPLLGWRNGIVICTFVGTMFGFARNDRLAWKWYLLLGLWHVSLGLTVGFLAFWGNPLNVYTIVMLLAGFMFIASGAFIGWKSKTNSLDAD